VRDSEELRKAVEEVQPAKVAFTLRLAQSRPLYEAFKALREGPDWASLSEARQRVVEAELRDFVLGGVGLEVGWQSRLWLLPGQTLADYCDLLMEPVVQAPDRLS
jgi:Zn-dependent oligopeptidase